VQHWESLVLLFLLSSNGVFSQTVVFTDDIKITRGPLPPSSNPGIVRLMLCSDTGTWDGQDVNVERNQARRLDRGCDYFLRTNLAIAAASLREDG